MFFRGQTIGKYKILSALGSGGFGTVYLAEDTWIDKKVALKVPHRQSVNFGELLREPRLLASLNHPNIVTVLTAEKQDNVFFIVMEYVAGETLETIIAREGALELPRALDFTCQICNAVDHAHRQGVLHRDLRPANVIVADNGLVKVADFGTSRFLELAAHGTTVIGSPPYMAPEQFHGRATFASDIYSLGVTMYQMMTGTLPYQTPAPADLERLMRGELVSPPRLRNGRIPQRVNDIILKAMAPEVTARYQRAADLLDDLLAADRTPAEADRRPPGLTPAAAQAFTAAPKPRETPKPRFCWHCRKPLPARIGPLSVLRGGAVEYALQGAHDGVFRYRQDLDERHAGRLGGREDPHRVARHPLRQRRVRGGALLQHPEGLGLLPPRRPHAPADRLGEDLPHGAGLHPGPARSGRPRHDPRQRDEGLLHPPARLPRLRRARRQPVPLPGRRGHPGLGMGRLPRRRRARERASTSR